MATDDIWDDLFGGRFDAMAKRMERMFSELERLDGATVRTYGYTMYRDSDGNNHVREFGNSAGNHGLLSDTAREPLTDVCLENGTVRAIIEIPGVSKEDIMLEGTKSTLSVSVNTDSRKFAKTLALPCDVDLNSATAEYNNGILEITLATVDSPASKKKIDIS